MDNNANNENKNFRHIVIGCLIGIILLIVLLTGFHVNLIINKIGGISANEALTASFIEIGLAIIGIAISVWAGLNIISAIDKKELDSVVRKTSHFKTKLHSLENSIESIRATGDYALFLSKIKSHGSAVSLYLYEKLDKINDTSDLADVCNSLLGIEQNYQRIVADRRGEDIEDDNQRKRIEETLSEIESIKSKLSIPHASRESILDYLTIRECFCYWYRGYTYGTNNAEKHRRACEDFDKTANGLEKVIKTQFQEVAKSELFDCRMVLRKCAIRIEQNNGISDEECREVLELLGNDRTLIRCFMVLINVIAESYSKILHRRTMNCCEKRNIEKYDKEVFENAEFYGLRAVAIQESIKETGETYYRNLGCTYERYGLLQFLNNKEDKQTSLMYYAAALEYYKTAFNKAREEKSIPHIRLRNVYRVLLSGYDRVIRLKLGLDPNPSYPCRFDSAVKKACLDHFSREDIRKCVKDFYYTATIAVRDLPREKLHYSMMAFAAIWMEMILKDEEENGTMSNVIQESFDTLGMLTVNDDYYKALKIRQTRMTGYPSIDKPWLKHYPKGCEKRPLPSKTIYEYVYDANKDHLQEYAFNYYGNRITYKEFFDNVDACAKSLRKLGVKMDDIVTIMGLATPETFYVTYALSKIGAIPNLINVTAGESELIKYLQESKSKLLVALDLFNETVDKAIPSTDVELVVNMSVGESMPLHLKVLYKLKQKIHPCKRAISWKDFISCGDDIADTEPFPYHHNRFSFLAHTGGTTGKSKGVMLTDAIINGLVDEDILNYDYIRQLSFINTIPPFYTYGFVVNAHIPLARGLENYLYPEVDVDKLPELILKHKINVVCSAPQFLTSLPKYKSTQASDYSFIQNIGCGGDGLTIELEEGINRTIAPNKVQSGYGLSEIGSMACGNFNKEYAGSVGYPISRNTISAFDPSTNQEMTYGEVGEICFLSPFLMLGYFKNEEETADAIRMHSDGNCWFHSGDLGYITEDGVVYITGRIKRQILTIYKGQGNKIYPERIDRLIEKHEAIDAACTVEMNGESPEIKLATYLVIKDDCLKQKDEIRNELIEICDKELPEYSRPSRYVFIDKMPMTDAGKIDYRELERRAAGGEKHE